MSRSRRVSATTSLPKPGALEPAWLGRSIAAISGWAELPAPAAASRLDFAMGHYSLAVGKNCGPIQPDHGFGRNPSEVGDGAAAWSNIRHCEEPSISGLPEIDN